MILPGQSAEVMSQIYVCEGCEPPPGEGAFLRFQHPPLGEWRRRVLKKIRKTKVDRFYDTVDEQWVSQKVDVEYLVKDGMVVDLRVLKTYPPEVEEIVYELP